MKRYTPVSKAAFTARVKAVKSRSGDPFPEPDAWALGIGTFDVTSDDELIDITFPHVNYKENLGSAAIVWGVSQMNPIGSFMTRWVTRSDLEKLVLPMFASFVDDGDPHPNIEAFETVHKITGHGSNYGRSHDPVLVMIPDLSLPPENMGDARLRLELISRRIVKPNEINLDGIFKYLPLVAWTNYGPFIGKSSRLQALKEELMLSWEHLHIYSLDKFPPMLDYVVPKEEWVDGEEAPPVRIADAIRVRLGAYLAPGTTVMHEGFVNFNAGTLGPSMVEGRISQGVVVGGGSDIGGGASILGTLSGGNKTKVKIGSHCLLEAESGLGIPLGARVRVEAGLYIKSTTPINLSVNGWDDDESMLKVILDDRNAIGAMPGDGTKWVKAEALAGINDAIFRRNAFTGRIEVIPRGDSTWGTLNASLHS